MIVFRIDIFLKKNDNFFIINNSFNLYLKGIGYFPVQSHKRRKRSPFRISRKSKKKRQDVGTNWFSQLNGRNFGLVEKR